LKARIEISNYITCNKGERERERERLASLELTPHLSAINVSNVKLIFTHTSELNKISTCSTNILTVVAYDACTKA
jgi:hypothetical protein